MHNLENHPSAQFISLVSTDYISILQHTKILSASVDEIGSQLLSNIEALAASEIEYGPLCPNLM